jgi:hypothetical protein
VEVRGFILYPRGSVNGRTYNEPSPRICEAAI